MYLYYVSYSKKYMPSHHVFLGTLVAESACADDSAGGVSIRASVDYMCVRLQIILSSWYMYSAFKCILTKV